MSRWVVFTDLDESLLDRVTYACEAARTALEELRRRGIPLVLCTSKTAPETLHHQRALGIADPFIVEAGGGVYVPKGYFPKLPGMWVDCGDRYLLPMSVSRDEVLAGLGHIKEATSNAVRGFDDMTDEEIARDTGLPIHLAALARRREFDEPFKFVRREAEFAASLPRLARERGLRVTRGGRYWHLHGDTDKGAAVRLLKALFREKLGRTRTLAVGDSEMDLPMLLAVDVPIAVLRADGRHEAALVAGVPNLRAVPLRGPEGWNRGVLEALKEPI
jgi:mannosyl-3-phosphoglycerate phosphatase